MNKEIEIRITPHSSSMSYYQVHWKWKKRFNLFNFWKRMVNVYDGAWLASYEWLDYIKRTIEEDIENLSKEKGTEI